MSSLPCGRLDGWAKRFAPAGKAGMQKSSIAELFMRVIGYERGRPSRIQVLRSHGLWEWASMVSMCVAWIVNSCLCTGPSCFQRSTSQQKPPAAWMHECRQFGSTSSGELHVAQIAALCFVGLGAPEADALSHMRLGCIPAWLLVVALWPRVLHVLFTGIVLVTGMHLLRLWGQSCKPARVTPAPSHNTLALRASRRSGRARDSVHIDSSRMVRITTVRR